MMRTLPSPPGYDRPDARAVGWLAAQLDDQSRLLARRLAGAGRELLEWQPRPGVNTIGMLMAHLAVVEAYWVGVVLSGKEEREDADRIVRDIIGIAMDDDGMPLAPDGGHPASLAGCSLEDYLALLERARNHTHLCLQGWDDTRLDDLVTCDGHQVSCGWVAYHLLEHFAQHAGQIALLQSLFRS